MVSNSAQIDRRTKQHTQFGVSASNGFQRNGPEKIVAEKKNGRVQSYIASPTGIANEEITKANWMVSNSAKLDLRTKQHTQFGVSASDGSRDMVQTKIVAEKKNKQSELNGKPQCKIIPKDQAAHLIWSLCE